MKKSILIVDDIEMNLVILKSYFMDKYEVFCGKNGKEALDILEKHNIDIIITDIFMPVMDGIELITNVRNNEKWKYINIVAITERDENNEANALKAGADDFVNKPFMKELILHRIETVQSQDNYKKNVSQYRFCFNQNNIPYATVKLVKDNKNKTALQFQYVNNSFSKISGKEKEFYIKEKPFLCESVAGFTEFFEEVNKGGESKKKLFFDEKSDKYFDVTAYQEAKDICSFIVTENKYARVEKYEKNRYLKQIRAILQENPNTIGIIHLNLSKDICDDFIGKTGFFSEIDKTISINDLFKKLEKYIALDDELKEFRNIFERDKIINDFKNGIASLSYNVPIIKIDNSLCWVQAYMIITENSLTSDIEAVYYCIDINETKMAQEIIDTVVKASYDSLLCFNFSKNTAKILSGDGNSYWTDACSIEEMDKYIEDYLEKKYIGGDKENFIKENKIMSIADKMRDMDTYSVEYMIKDDENRERLKKGTYYWIDTLKNVLCFTRTDITDAFEHEQKRNKELEQLLKKTKKLEKIKQELWNKQELIHIETIKEKDLMLDNLLQNIPGGIGIYKVGEKSIEELYSNEGLSRITGRTMKEYKEKSKNGIFSIVHKDDMELIYSEINKKKRDGKSINVSFRVEHKNGLYIWVQLSAVKIRDEKGTPIYYAIFTTMKDEVVRYMNMCEDAPSGIYVTDRNTHKIIYMNKVAKKMVVNKDIEEYTTHKCYKYIMGKDSPCEFCKNSADSTTMYDESTIYLKELDKYYNIRRKRVDWNGVDSYLAFISDDTYKIKVNEKNKKLKEAEAANAAKTKFLARMSHDLRTPLNAIIGFSSNEIINDSSNDEKLEYFSKVNSSSKYLLGLINDLLDMSKIESGKIELVEKTYGIYDIIEHINTIVAPIAAAKNVTYKFRSVGVKTKYIKTDRKRVEQIFINLLNNAIKFTCEGGQVDCELRHLKIENARVYDRITISDNGIGMSEEFQRCAFEPFTQEQKVQGEGTGLGLSIVKSIVEKMNGTISCSSKEGVGTTFIIEMSFKIDDKKDTNFNKKCNCFDILKGKNILLCEDNSLNRQIAGMILKKKEIEVTYAINGREAVEFFEKSELNFFDAILMDIRMPELNGLEATKKIRQIDRGDAKNIPIIAMTANAYEEDIRASIEAGMNEHLAKPIDPEVLYNTLCKYLL